MNKTVWQRIDETSTAIFRILMRLGILILALFLIMVLLNGVKKQTPTVQPFEVPESWEQVGLNGQTVARRVVDQVEEIKNMVNSAKSDSTFLESGSGTDLEVNVMGVGLSLNAFSYYLKSLLKLPNPTISGEIIDVDSTIILTMRMTDYPTLKHSIDYRGKSKLTAIEETLEAGGKIILEQTDPYRIAVYHYHKKNYEQSLDIIRAMIQRNDRDIQWAYLAWANLLKDQGRESAGREKLLKAIEYDPKFMLAHRNLAWSLFQDRKYEEAITNFRRAYDLDNEDIGCINGLAQAHRQLGEYDQAERYFKRAIEVDPSITWMYFNYGSMKLYQQHDTAAAMEIFHQCKEVSTDPIDYNFTMMNFYFAQGMMDSVNVLLDEVLEIDDHNRQALQLKFRLYYNDSLYREAIQAGQEFLTKADTLNGDGPSMTISMYNLMGMSAYHLGNYEQAIDFAQKAINKDPNNGIPYTTLAEAYWYWGKIDLFYQYIKMAFERGVRIQDIMDTEPYPSILNDVRFKEIYEKYEMKG